jgi:hypothetical protein
LVNTNSNVQRKKIKLSKKDGGIGEEILSKSLIEDDLLKSNDENDNANNKKNEEYIILKEIPKEEGEEDFEFCLRRNIFNLKERIEMNFEKFFQYKIKIDKVMKEIVEGLKNLCENEDDLFESDYIQYNKLNGITINQNINADNNKENKQFNFNNFLRERRVKKYQEKLKLMIQEKITFLSYKIFDSPNAINDLIDELILSSFDTTITKIFFMDIHV